MIIMLLEFQNMKEYNENVPHDCRALGKNHPNNCKSVPSKDVPIKPYVLACQPFHVRTHIKFWVSCWEPNLDSFV